MSSPPAPPAEDAAAATAADQSHTTINGGGADGQPPPPPSPPSNAALPLLLTAKVVKGFNRGGKLLGCPTANMNMEEIESHIQTIPNGIYYGWAFMRGQVYKAVASVGFNPYFNNKQKTCEPHLLDYEGEDFYEETLRFLVCGYVRNEQSFPSLEALVAAIKNDIAVAAEKLDESEWQAYGKTQLGWTTE